MSPDNLAVRVAHASLRYDVEPGPLASYLARIVGLHSLRAFTTTESRSPELVEAVRKLLPDYWRVERRHEYLIAWDTTTFGKRGRTKLRRLSGLLYGGRRFRMAEQELVALDIDVRVRLQAGHAPARIGGGHKSFSDRDPKRVKAAVGGWAKWKRLNARLSRRRPRRVIVSHLDANLDQRSAHWREYLTDVYGGPSVYRNVRPNRGTHGVRLIDTAHVSGPGEAVYPIVSPVTLPAGLDHRAIVYLLRVQA